MSRRIRQSLAARHAMLTTLPLVVALVAEIARRWS
jgi:hypothetical protein